MILDGLNEEQLAAVTAPPGPAIVMAGPGSGKTRVLTHRVAYLVLERGVEPAAVLALTFTKDAAGEMLGRVESLIGADPGVRMCTTHSWCYRFLSIRAHYTDGVIREWREAGGDMLSDFRHRVLWQIAIDKSGAKGDLTHSEAAERASLIKNHGLTFQAFREQVDPDDPLLAAWKVYESLKRREGKLDYDDLLVLALRELQDDGVAERERVRVGHVLVDEVQDLNRAQWGIIHRLAPPPDGDVFAVGDVDQAIYEWRGASPDMALEFTRAYPNARTFMLRSNYRSTPEIVRVADELIANNVRRAPRSSVPIKGPGVEPAVEILESPDLEGKVIADRAMDWMLLGRRPSEVAVLFRVWWLTRATEEALARAGIPYRVFGGYGFFDRREVVDLLAYLRLAQNPEDDDAVRVVLNVPNRFLGREALEVLEESAHRMGRSLWEAIPYAGWQKSWQRERAVEFHREVGMFWRIYGDRRPGDAMREIAARIGYRRHLLAAFDDGEERIDNARELMASADQYPTIGAFLNHVEFVRSQRAESTDDAVALTTIHRAKGTEYPCIVVAGMAEGVLPHERAESCEEERRLAYVGMTRAEDELVLTASRLYGDKALMPSRFLMEAGFEVVDGFGDENACSAETAPADHDAPQTAPL